MTASRGNAHSAAWPIVIVAILLVIAAAMRRDFLGDGVRHLGPILDGVFSFGEPRWLLFPPLLFALLRPLAATGAIATVEGAIQPFLWTCVLAGILYAWSLSRWLRAESDVRSIAPALLLALSSASFLRLYSDIAEPQVAAAVAVSALAYARVHRDREQCAGRAALVAVVVIGVAALVYQGLVLAFAMLPLIVSRKTLTRPRYLTTVAVALALVVTAMVGVQLTTGVEANEAVARTMGGEMNPATRSFMATRNPVKYLTALVAGPPQAIVALVGFSGLRALADDARAGDARATSDLARLVLGGIVTLMIAVTIVRRRDWRLAAAALALLLLPVVRNQQYAYPKFYALWPVIVALAALHWRKRATLILAVVVLTTNVMVIAGDIVDGRRLHARMGAAYANATADTCWFTSGWAPPVPYLWPGRVAPVLGTLATGQDPADQRNALTSTLRACFCDSRQVWTDTTEESRQVLAVIARHFEYREVELSALLLPPSSPPNTPHVYPDGARQQACRTLPPSENAR